MPGARDTVARRRSTSRGERRRRDVLDAATRMFHEHGYVATSIEDVATAVGLLKGSLYYYIDSKEDLLFEVLEDVHADVQRLLDAAVAQTEVSPLERLAAFVRSQVDYNARNVEKISVYYHEWERLTGERLVESRRRRREQEDVVVELIEAARVAGDVPADQDARLAARCVFATVVWPYTWYRAGASEGPEELAAYVTRFVLGGLAAPAATPRPRRRAR